MADSLSGEIIISRDESFKDIVRYKAIMAIIVKFAIPEFNNMSLTEIAKLIIDTRPRSEEQSDLNILEQEIDFIPSESGTKDEKNTIQDASFRILKEGRIAKIQLHFLDDVYTVNTEMQNETKTSKLGYNILSRAVYYGATLLRDTVPAGDTKYTGIHKVYTIWLCMNNLPDMSIMPNGEVIEELKNKAVHRYNFRRSYADIPNKTVPPEKYSDLIEIVLVEIKKLSKEDSDAAKLLYNLFYNTNSIVEHIEQVESVSLTKVKKGVYNMVNAEDYKKIGLEEGRAEGKAEGKAEIIAEIIRAYNLQNKTFNEIKEKLKRFKCSDEIIRMAQEMIKSE